MISEPEYLEADTRLAEQMGECVHDWKEVPILTVDHYTAYSLSCRKCHKKIHWEKNPPVCKPRSKDLGAMVNVVDKLGYLYKVYTVTASHGKHTIVKLLSNDGKHIGEGTAINKDHPSPQHAAAWALVLALQEVKK